MSEASEFTMAFQLFTYGSWLGGMDHKRIIDQTKDHF